ncbi:unnamed protein product [Schistosoma curassoni]|uniref:Transposase n=1 Tax=Schistosoma curassoni TaxID=6186 RepID=A0A183JFR4_9TREM|nr:unnamed protein product [Schistosoma curassoni]
MVGKKAATEGNIRTLYDTTKKLAGKYGKPDRLVKDKESKPLIAIQGKWTRWAEHFEGLLSRPAPLNAPDVRAAHIDLPIDVTRPIIKKISTDDRSRETLDLGFVLLDIRQQGVPVILRDLMLPDGFDHMSPSFTVRDVTTGYPSHD